MPAFHPSPQPSGVGPAGTIVPVTIPPGYRRFNIRRAIVTQSAGSATSYHIHLSTDPSGAEHIRNITHIDDASPSNPADFDNNGSGYVWNPEDSDGVIYVHIIPFGSALADNDYEVRLIVSRTL